MKDKEAVASGLSLKGNRMKKLENLKEAIETR